MNHPVLKPLAAALCCCVLASLPATAAERELGEVRVEAERKFEVKPRLRDEIIATESFGQAAIERVGASNVNEAVDKNPGVSVQTECSICNVRNVVLNNLPGRYTTLLLDGIPIYSSVSSAYGLDSIGINGIERIDISRGAGTSLIAPEALAGVVNLVTRRPTRDYNDFSATLGSYGSRRADAYLARPFEGGAASLSFNYNRHDTVDADGNGISEYTGYQRAIGGLGWFLDDLGGFKVKGRVDLVREDRGGGALGFDYDAIKTDRTGNPFDFSKGPHGSPDPAGWLNPSTGALIPYTNGRAGFSEIIFTDRWQATVTGERRLGDGKLRLAAAYAQHKQDSFYETDIYKAEQDQYYLEVSTQQPLGETLLTAGLNYRYEDLTSRGFGEGGTVVNDGIDNYVYRTPALFLQAYRAFLDGRLEANGSVRFDKHNVFGNITSPRVNLLYHHSDQLNSRVAFGKGFRAPTSFFEQDHGILNTISIVRRIDKPEISENASYALNYASDRLAWVTSANWNRIKNMAMLDSGQCRDAGGALYPGPCKSGDDPVTLFTSAQRPVTVAGVDITATYKWTGNVSTTLGAERFHYRFDPGTLVFARPETRVYLAVDYDAGPWDFFAKATWTGRQNLRKFYDYDNNPRYNFDGTPKRDWSPSFWVVDARAEYKVNRQVSLVLGGDNLFDYKQADHENFLWVGSDGSYDVTHFWGPSRGRYWYGSIKLVL